VADQSRRQKAVTQLTEQRSAIADCAVGKPAADTTV
jgi:hypothetical protein